MFEIPTTLPPQREISEACAVPQCFRDKKLLLSVVQKEAGSAKGALNNQIR